MDIVFDIRFHLAWIPNAITVKFAPNQHARLELSALKLLTMWIFGRLTLLHKVS